MAGVDASGRCDLQHLPPREECAGDRRDPGDTPPGRKSQAAAEAGAPRPKWQRLNDQMQQLERRAAGRARGKSRRLPRPLPVAASGPRKLRRAPPRTLRHLHNGNRGCDPRSSSVELGRRFPSITVSAWCLFWWDSVVIISFTIHARDRGDRDRFRSTEIQRSRPRSGGPHLRLPGRTRLPCGPFRLQCRTPFPCARRVGPPSVARPGARPRTPVQADRSRAVKVLAERPPSP